MTDPSRYLRKAIKSALEAGALKVYDIAPLQSATAPYILVNIAATPKSSKNTTFFECNVELSIFAEYREFAGSKEVDVISDRVFNQICPPSGGSLVVENFNNAGSIFQGSSTNIENVGDVTVIRKTMRVKTFLSE
jgi:hypothetical protein